MIISKMFSNVNRTEIDNILFILFIHIFILPLLLFLLSHQSLVDVNSIIICKITNILLYSHHISFTIQLFSRQHNHSILYTSQNRIIAPYPITSVCCSFIIYQLTRYIMLKASPCRHTIYITILEKCQLFISPSMNHSS